MKNIKISVIGVKIITIFILLLLFMLPTALIRNLICDRQDYQNEAVNSIVEPLGRKATFEGAFIAIPYKYSVESTNPKGEVVKEVKTNYIMFAPNVYNLDVNIDSSYLTRGIYKVPIYSGTTQFNIQFEGLDFSNTVISKDSIEKDGAMLLIGISDKKNIASSPVFKINENNLKMLNSSFDFPAIFNKTLCYSLKGIDVGKKIDIIGELDFQGGESFNIIPIAWDNVIKMHSNWKTPGFGGGFLPSERFIDNKGFNAIWNISGINTLYPKSWIFDGRIMGESLRVDLVQHINNYSKSMRSIKYAILFLLIPFLALFVLETISKIRIHPLQYILIGSTDIIFYLLLISISEHINFNLSYLICCISVVIPAFIYVSTIFKSLKSGYILSGVQIISYLFLYATLQSEDYALLIGSIGLFIVLITFMMATRKIDWYSISKNDE